MSATDNAVLGDDISRRGGDDQQASRGTDSDRWGPEGTDLRRSLKRGREDDEENRRSQSPTSSTETLSGPGEQAIYHDGKGSSAWAERAKAWRNDRPSWPENDGKSTDSTSNAQSTSVAAPGGWGGMHTHQLLENAPTNRAAGQQSTTRPFDSSEGSPSTTAPHSSAATTNTSTPTDQGSYHTSSAYTPQATRAPPSSTPSWHAGPHHCGHPSRTSSISMLGSMAITTSSDAAMQHSSGNRVSYGGGGVGYNRGEGMIDCNRRTSSSSREHYGDGHGVRTVGGGRAEEISDEEILARIQDERRLSRNAREQKRSLKINVRFDNLRDALSHCGAGLGKKSSSKSDILAEATDCISRLLRQRTRADEERSRMLHLLENAYQASSHNPASVGKPQLHPSQQHQRQQTMASAMASMIPSVMSRNQYASTSLQAQAGLNGRMGGNAFTGYIGVEDMHHHTSPNRPFGRASNGGPDRTIGTASVGVVGPNNGPGILMNSNGDMHRGGAALQLHSSQSSTAMSSAASAAMVHASKGFRVGGENTVVDGRASIGGVMTIQAPSIAVGLTSSTSGLSPGHTAVGIVNSNGNVGSVNGIIDPDGVIAGNGIIPANGIVANGIIAGNSGCTDEIAAALLNSSRAPRIAPSSGSSLPAHHGNNIGNNSNNSSLTAHLTPAAAAALGASGIAAPPTPTQAQLAQEFTQVPAAAGTWMPGMVSGTIPGTGFGNGLRTSQANSPRNGSGNGSPLSSHGRHQQGVAAADENGSDQEWDAVKNHRRSEEITAGSSGAVAMTAGAAGGGEGDWGVGGGAGLVAGSGASTTGSAVKNDSLDWMFHASEVPMAIADMSCNLLDCNARLTQVTGLSRQDAPLVTIFDLVAEGFVQHAFSMIGSMLALPAEAKYPPVQVQGRKRDGSTCGWMQISVERDGNFRPAYLSICLLESATAYPENMQR